MLNNQIALTEPSSTGDSLDAGEVGTRVLRVRLRFGMSQRKLAKVAGVTNGTISMIEQNRVSPSVASLKKILEAFGMTLGEFFSSDFGQKAQVFYRAHELPRLADERVVLRQVGGGFVNRKLQVLHETYAPGGDTGSDLISHDGEEAGVIVRGKIELTVGGQCEVLGAGDAYYFNSRLPHRFRNIHKEECEIVSTCTPPTF
mgnify:CR=1 FL=1